MRAAIIGLGDIGRRHVEVVAGMPEYELVAVAESDGPTLAGLPADAAVVRCRDLSEAIERSRPDAVVVATPPATHADVVAAALRAGVHVYCEKPLALAAADAASLVSLARDRDRRLHAGMQWRHRPGYAEARAAIAAGAIGAIRRAEVIACSWYRSARHFRRRPWRGRWAGSGGGVLLSQALHQVDVLCWLLGEPVAVEGAIGRVDDAVEVEDQAVADVRFASGAICRLVARSTDFVGIGRILVHGERGTIELDPGRARMVALDVPVEEASSAVPRTERILGESDPQPSLQSLLEASHREFLRGIVAPGDAADASTRDAVRALAVVNGIYHSALRGSPVELPPQAADYAQLLEELADGRVSVPCVGPCYLPPVAPANAG